MATKNIVPRANNEGGIGTAAKKWANVEATTIKANGVDLGANIHSNTNDPSADQKAALAGTSGAPSGTNKFVTNDDSRNTDARTPAAHNHAGADINSGTVDGDRLPALSATKKGGVPATGTPSGLFLKDDDTWSNPAVKATGAEINTGTDDAKFATAKAIADSDIAFLPDIPTVPAGNDTEVQLNLDGLLSSSPDFTFDPTAKKIYVGGEDYLSVTSGLRTGICHGMVPSISGTDATKLNFTAGEYYIQGQRFIFNETNGVDPEFTTGKSSKRIGVDASGFVKQDTNFTMEQKQTILPLVRAQAVQGQTGPGSTIGQILDWRFLVGEEGYWRRIWHEEAIGALYYTGGLISKSSTERQINENSGVLHDAQMKRHILVGTNDIQAITMYHVGGALTLGTKATLVISNTQYDNGTDLTTMTDGYWAAHTLLKSPKAENEFFLVYSAAQYASQALAEAAASDYSAFVNQATSSLIDVALIIIQKGSSVINDIKDRRPFRGGNVGATLGTSSLQQTYENSASPEITVDSTRGALTIRDNVVPIGANLLEVLDNASTPILEATATQVKINGNIQSGANSGDGAGAGTAQWNADKIQGKDFPTLGAGDDEKYPKYDNDTNAFVMTAIAGGGDVVGPASAVDGNFPAFDGVTGKPIKDSGTKPSDFVTHSLATAVSDFLVASGVGAFIKKTYAQTRDLLGLSRMSYNVVDDYGAVGDAQTVFDGAMTSGVATLTCATSAPFVAGDVGKRITVAGAGASGAQLTTAIVGYTSSSIVTLTATAGTTVSAKGVTFGTDDTTAIQNAFNAAANATYPGVIVYFPRTSTNRFLITSTLTSAKTIHIIGQGGVTTTDIGDYTKSGGTWLVWNGTSSLPLLSIIPTAGASNTAVVSPKIEGINFDCRNGDQNQALYGIQAHSAHGYFFHDFYVMDALVVGIDLQAIQGSLGEAKDITRGLIERFTIRQLDANQAALGSTTTTGTGTFATAPFSLPITSGTNFITAGYCWVESNMGYPVLVNYTGGGGTTTLTGCTVDAQEVLNAPTWVAGCNVVQCSPSNACAIRLDGVTTANSCESLMLMGQLSHGTTWGPAAIEFKNADSWECIKMLINGGNATNDGAINRVRKPGVRFNGSNTTASLTARNNCFRSGSAGAGGVSVMGVNNAGTRLTAMAVPNYWDLYEMGNGEPIPVVEGGASFDWKPNGGLRSGAAMTVSVANQAVTAATSTLLTGSLVAIPPQGFQIGTTIRWTFQCSKTAAGTAARTFYIRIGTTGTTSDAIVATMAVPLGTAVVDNGWGVIEFTVRGPLGASCAGTAMIFFAHGLATTGFMTKGDCTVISATMATWNSSTAQQFVSITFTSGASEVVTFQQMQAMCINSANP